MGGGAAQAFSMKLGLNPGPKAPETNPGPLPAPKEKPAFLNLLSKNVSGTRRSPPIEQAHQQNVQPGGMVLNRQFSVTREPT